VRRLVGMYDPAKLTLLSRTGRGLEFATEVGAKNMLGDNANPHL